MLQIIQYQKNGEISVEDLPDLTCPPNGILVKNYYSLISAGTERTSVETAKASLIGKAKTRPDLVKQVIDNIKKEGFLATYKKVLNRLDNYKELGYSSSGIVIESKTNVFKPGDRVACAGFAYHSELVGIPKNLAVKVPDEVSLREAAFTTIGAIALQGVRQAKVNLGETVVVIGLGLIGLITVQLLKANGCKVIGLDINERNFGLAEGFGCNYCFKLENNFINKIHNLTNGFGADAVIITASTNTSEPMEDAIKIARKKGRIVIVGTLKIVIPRQEFYEKELEITISCSYGPGRYDYNYEIKGLDYPYNYVRWTENRNMEAILELLREKKINFEKLITHEIPIEEGLKAYEIITGKVKEQHIGILIKYNQEKDLSRNYTKENFKVNKTFDSKIVVGFIGAGNFAQSYLLPYLKSKEIELRKVATKTPITAKSVAEKFGFKYYSTSPEEILDDPHINTIFIVTNHSTHGKFVKEALKRNKNVFVEKPLCITEEELMDIKDIYTKSTSKLFVGFNRRFSKQFELIKNFFHNRTEPLFILYRVNAGFIPSDHWIQRIEEGGRLIGEGCHFIDIFDFLIESDIKEFDIKALNNRSDLQIINDNFILTIKYNDGSVATLLYNSNGDRGIEKEYFEIHSEGKSARLIDFNEVHLSKNGRLKKYRFDGKKGHKEEIDIFYKSLVENSDTNLSFESIYKTTFLTIEATKLLKNEY